MSTLKDIRDKYGVPAKRGQVVRYCPGRVFWTGVITSANRNDDYLNIGVMDIRICNIHPFDLDWFIDGAWATGDSFKAKHDARIDAWNKALNRQVAP